MKKNTKWVLGLLALVLAGGAAVGLRRSPPLPPPMQEKPAETAIELAEADLATAEPGEVRRVLPVTGALRAISQAVVKAKVAGDVTEVAVKEGDAVRPGQLMARIDVTEYQARLDERKANLEAARAQARFAEQSRKKYQELLAKKFISETAYDNYQTNANVTEGQVHAAEAQLVLARKALEDTQVRAPIAGSVSERALQRGDKAAVDARMFTIVDLSRLELEAPVPAAEVPNLAIGQQVRFRVEGYGTREFAGSIVRINPATQPGTRSILIYVEIPNPDQALKAGMFAKGGLTLAAQRAEVLVPVTALRTDAAATFVYAIAGDRVARQDVTVGLANEAEGRAEIVKGLAPGARVVRVNLGPLKIGAPVRVVAPAKPQ